MEVQISSTYEYTSDRAKVREVIEKSNLNYKYVLIHFVQRAGIWYYTTVYFMNEENKEIGYANIDMFPLSGYLIHDEPRVWGLWFLTHKAYRRYEKKEIDNLIKNHKQLDDPQHANIHNDWFKNMENHANFVN